MGCIPFKNDASEGSTSASGIPVVSCRRKGGWADDERMSEASKVQAAYGAEQIQVLEGLEPVRKRPGM